MKKTGKDNRPTGLRPVKKIELSEKHTTLRFVLVIALILVAAVSLTYGLMSLLNKDDGWKTIEINDNVPDITEEIVVNYNLGASGASATVEYKAISALYTDIGKRAYIAFHADQGFDGSNNLFTLNENPNKVFTVDDLLYGAFATMEKSGSRYLYLGPVYEQYSGLFSCENDAFASEFDPRENEEVRNYLQKVVAFAGNPDHIRVELLGENQVQLIVSDAYLQFAKENGITRFLDFSYLKNAFVVDAIADTMIEKGYTHGNITSFDGYTRNLDNSGNSYAINVFSRVGNTVYPATVLHYTGAKSIVNLRSFPMTTRDVYRYYIFEGGRTETMYVDPADALSKHAASAMVFVSDTVSCVDMILQALPVYLADSVNTETLQTLQKGDISSVWCDGETVYYNDGKWEPQELYKDETVAFSKKKI